MLGWTGTGVVAGAVGAAVPSAGSPVAGSPVDGRVTLDLELSSVKTGVDIVVAPPTGVAANDTANVLKALSKAVAGAAVVFQTSPTAVYMIDQELPVPRGVRLTGTGVTSESGDGSPARLPTLRQAAGVPLHCLAGSASYLAGLYGPANPGRYPTYNALYRNGKQHHYADSAIEVDHLAFDGQNGGTGSGNTAGHGVVLLSNGSSVHDCYFVDIANAAVVAADLNWAGVPCGDPTFENRIFDNTIVNPAWYGVWVTNTAGSAGCTDGYILKNIVVSPSQQLGSSGPLINPSTLSGGGKGLYSEGIHLANAAGWWVSDNHLEACPGNGIYCNTTWGLHLVDNTVDGFGCFPTAHTVFTGLNIVTAGQEKTHPGFIIGNLVAAYEGANPYAPATPAPFTTTFEYFKVSMQDSAGRKVESSYHSYVAMADNVAHQASQLPAPISGATIAVGNLNKVTVPNGSTTGVEVGMGIADTSGLIPSGAKVKAVEPGAGTAPDALLLTLAASGAGTADTVSFTGPTTVAWSFVNDLYDSVLQVNRTNETTTGTIDPVPVVSITSAPPPSGSTTPVITIIDPVASVSGLVVESSDRPSAGDVLVAATGSASWKSVSVAMAPDPPAGGILSGTYPDPGLSVDAVTVVTASGQVVLPEWVTAFRLVCVGGGGGGGGGTSGQGGGGGAAGTSAEQFVSVEAPAILEVTIGSGGPGGAAGSGASSGGSGTGGGSTLVAVGQITMAAPGGPGGSGAGPGSDPAPGGVYGGAPGTTSTVVAGSSGGGAGQTGGDPFSYSPGGGGGGGSATATNGGGGGACGTPAVGGAPGISGVSSSGSGQPGTDAVAPGAGGGGGGSGSPTAPGGAGGDGGDGFVIVEVIR